MSAPGRGCVKTQNQKPQVGNSPIFIRLRDRKWDFLAKLSDEVTHLLDVVPKTMTAK